MDQYDRGTGADQITDDTDYRGDDGPQLATLLMRQMKTINYDDSQAGDYRGEH